VHVIPQLAVSTLTDFFTVIVGRDGWLFYDNGDHIGYPAASKPLSAIDLDVWTSVFNAHARWLADRNAAYVVLVAPAKEDLYADRLPQWAQVPMDELGNHREGT
jgi:hypothetical protein